MLRARRSFEVVRAIAVFGGLAACSSKSPDAPRVPAARSQTIATSRAGHALAGVAADGTTVFAAYRIFERKVSVVEARRGGAISWSANLDGTAGELAVAGSQIGVVLATHGEVGAGPGSGPTGTEMRIGVRGDPGAMLVALDRASGARRWHRPFESTEWVILTSVAAIGDELVVGGSFGGTLRIADKVVTSGGGSDGFVARIRADGKLAWLVRLGGTFSDGVHGVAVGGDPKSPRIAIAGAFSLTAEIQGEPLKSIDDKSPFGDGFVAELDGNGVRRWSASFGSRADDVVAGVAIDPRGEIVVAANVHEALSIAGSALVPRGAGDGLVIWYGAGGELGNAVLVGGNDFDGLRAIAMVGEHVIVGGFFSGKLGLGDRELAAGGGDDAFLAALDANGTVATAWHVGGDGREELTSLAAFPGGFVAGIAHTLGANVEDAKLAAPPAGTTGAALAVRGL